MQPEEVAEETLKSRGQEEWPTYSENIRRTASMKKKDRRGGGFLRSFPFHVYGPEIAGLEFPCRCSNTKEPCQPLFERIDRVLFIAFQYCRTSEESLLCSGLAADTSPLNNEEKLSTSCRRRGLSAAR